MKTLAEDIADVLEKHRSVNVTEAVSAALEAHNASAVVFLVDREGRFSMMNHRATREITDMHGNAELVFLHDVKALRHVANLWATGDDKALFRMIAPGVTPWLKDVP